VRRDPLAVRKATLERILVRAGYRIGLPAMRSAAIVPRNAAKRLNLYHNQDSSGFGHALNTVSGCPDTAHVLAVAQEIASTG
jgi:hypothetical protein